MKRILKAIIKKCWRLTAPLRRPIHRKLTGYLAGVLHAEVRPHLEAIKGGLANLDTSINIARCTADAHATEANLTLDSLVRELARLQLRIETLEQAVDEAGARANLSLIDADEATPMAHAAKAG